jgi:hypothetical protein
LCFVQRHDPCGRLPKWMKLKECPLPQGVGKVFHPAADAKVR